VISLLFGSSGENAFVSRRGVLKGPMTDGAMVRLAVFRSILRMAGLSWGKIGAGNPAR